MTTQVLRQINLPAPPDNVEDVGVWIKDVLIPAVIRAIEQHLHGYPESIRGEIGAKEYTAATKPAAADAGAGRIVYVSDGGAGAQFQGSTGAAWVNLG